jgi:hypothetical protein
MNTHAVSVQHIITLAVVALALAVPTVAVAQQQQQPLTGQMMDGQNGIAPTTATATAAPTATQSAPAAPSALDDAATYNPAQFGDTTRHVLQLQVDGSLAGKHLPMLGDEAGASYQRYMKSFEHPIPEFFQATVAQNPSNGR